MAVSVGWASEVCLAAGLPRTPPDVAALVAFVEERASLLYGVALGNEAVADPGLASKARRPR